MGKNDRRFCFFIPNHPKIVWALHEFVSLFHNLAVSNPLVSKVGRFD